MARIRVSPAAFLAAFVVVGLAVGHGQVTLLLGLAIAAAAAMAIASQPAGAVFALILLIPFNDYVSQRLGLGSSDAQLFGAGKDGILFLLGAVVFIRRDRMPRSLALPISVCLVLAAGSSLFTGNAAQALYGFRNSFEPLLLILLVPCVLTASSAKKALTFFVGVSQIAAFIAIYTASLGMQWLSQMDVFSVTSGMPLPSSYFVNGSMKPRAFSPYIAPNELGVGMGLALAVIASRTDWSLRRRALLSALPLVALLLSRSRSAMLGVALLAVVLLGRYLARRKAALVGVAGALLVAGIGLTLACVAITGNDTKSSFFNDSSARGHYASLGDSASKALSHPMGFGVGKVGPRALRYTDDPVLTESFLLLIALEAGLVTGAMYGLLLYRIWRTGRKAGHSLAFLPAAAVIVTIVNQAVLPSFQSPVGWLVWIIVGIGLTCNRQLGEASMTTTSTGPRVGVGTEMGIGHLR
jgi:putative inorganic carbon (hco3(-)) transporter